MLPIESIRKMTINELERIINWDAADRFIDSPENCDYYTIEMAVADLTNNEDEDTDPELYADEMNIYIAWAKLGSDMEV